MYRWPAAYFDGASALRRSVTISPTSEGIVFALDDGTTRHWSRKQFRRIVQPGGGHVRFERTPYTGEALEIDDPEAVPAMLAGSSVGTPGVTSMVGMAALSGLALWGLWLAVPFVTAGIARLLPRTVEEQLGKVVVAAIVPAGQRIESAQLESLARPVTRRIIDAADRRWRYRVIWQRTPQVNALAAPGGQIVVYCGLVHHLGSGDQLAAILAHEVTHVTERHSTRNLVRTLGARLLLSLGGGADIFVDGVAMLGALAFMRSDEEAADAGGLSLLERAGIDPAAMAAAFARIENLGADAPRAMRYLSTHPAVGDRKKKAAQFANVASGTRRPVMSASEWRELQRACPER